MTNMAFLRLIQIFSICLTNGIGIIFIAIIYILIRKKPKSERAKFIMSVKLALFAEAILFVVALDVGIYFWIKSNQILAGIWILPFIVGIDLILFPIILLGAYVQLTYREKIQAYIDTVAKVNR